MNARTFGGVKMCGTRLWVTAIVLQVFILTATSAKPKPLRRSLPSQQSLPLSKGGWRPVVGSNGLIYGYGTAPLHAPSYKIQVPVLDYASSARPHTARDATKLTSIAQSYRPTTLRTIPAGPPSPAASQPISQYLNPFALPSNGLSHYKYIQNFPAESVLIRNPHNPYAARPVFGKPYPTKQPYNIQKQYQQQQYSSIQPIQFPIATGKPLDFFAKPVNGYAKPTDAKTAQSGNTEIYKTEVFKLSDSDTAQQQQQQVKTAQQSLVTPKIPVSPHPQYQYQDQAYASGILGTFGSFGVHQVKGRDPIFPTKSTFFPPQTTKQTIFNSFSFAPNFKTTPTYISTTPKLQTTANQIHFSTNWNDFKTVVTQAPKAVTPGKIDPNSNKGSTFKPSPQDPFINKYGQLDYRVSTYNPTVQTTTFAYSNFHDNSYNNYPSQQQQLQQQQQAQHQQQAQQQQNAQVQNYYNSNNQQQDTQIDYKKKQKIHAHDSVAAGVNQQHSHQYASPPKTNEDDGTQNAVPFRSTYEVTETYEELTSAPPQSWPGTDGQKSTEEVVTKTEFEYYTRPSTILPDHEEFAIVTEGEKGYENSLSYDHQVESQSRRPLGDDFEPIHKHKLKDYYYRVSTPSYDDQSGGRRKKPTESSKYSAPEVTTGPDTNKQINEADPLPTLPPNKHFKRPSPSSPAPEPLDKDRIRKRNKIRRRRPIQGGNRDRESSTRRYQSSTTEVSIITEETHTIRPRVRPTQARPNLTTPTTSAVDLTTSALPTISPTSPTIIKKKLVHRRPYTTTTTEKSETTTATHESYKESNKESPIMKISASSRIPIPRVTMNPFEYKISDTPDYTHKQDEKDTPSDDIAVGLSESLKTTSKSETKTFSFHRDAKPVEAKLEPIIREVFTTEAPSSESNEVTTTAPTETSSSSAKLLRPRLKNKFGRPGFSVKEYRNRLSSTTSTEKPTENATPKLRFPNRRLPSVSENKVDNENSTERKKFTPKDPRHKNGSDLNDQTEKEIHSIRPNRQKQTTETPEPTSQKISARIRNGQRRPKPTEETVETSTHTVSRRPLRKKIKDTDNAESVQDVSITETNEKNDITSERTRGPSESAIMKIADKKHHDHIENLFEHSKRVSDLTLAASKDYNTPGMFKTVASNSRRIPNYFTIATDDPILPIEAFFPQINQKKES